MRTIITETKAYTFDELSEEQKEKAINNLRDINLDYDWYDFIYDEAKELGFVITGFDLDRNLHCTIKIIELCIDIANNIIKNHGESTGTYKAAREYITEYNKLEESRNDDNDYETDQKIVDCDTIFRIALQEEYASMLQKEYEYRYSDEAIIETIQLNEYEFTAEGKLI